MRERYSDSRIFLPVFGMSEFKLLSAFAAFLTTVTVLLCSVLVAGEAARAQELPNPGLNAGSDPQGSNGPARGGAPQGGGGGAPAPSGGGDGGSAPAPSRGGGAPDRGFGVALAPAPSNGGSGGGTAAPAPSRNGGAGLDGGGGSGGALSDAPRRTAHPVSAPVQNEHSPRAAEPVGRAAKPVPRAVTPIEQSGGRASEPVSDGSSRIAGLVARPGACGAAAPTGSATNPSEVTAQPAVKALDRPTEPMGGALGREKVDPAAGRLHETAEPLTEPVGRSAEPVLESPNETLQPVTKSVETTDGPVLDAAARSAEPVQVAGNSMLGDVEKNAIAPVLDDVREASQPLVGVAGETLGPTVGVVGETIEPGLSPVRQTVEPLAGTIGVPVRPVGETIEPTLGSVAPATGSVPMIGSVSQTWSPVFGPGDGAPTAPEPVSAPVTGVMPAAGSSASGAASGLSRGVDGGLAVGSPPSWREAPPAANASLAWARVGALAVQAKVVSSARGVRGPPAVAAGLRALTLTTTHSARDERLTLLFSGRLLTDNLVVASGASAPNGGPTPLLPAAPSSAGSFTSGLGSSVGGGVGLGVLALLLALSPLGLRLLRHSSEILRPNSALVSAIERPG